ncbi:hypothetical protein MuYL_1862 [Mucilaginibacter xinganensis]|uniref:Uncharacterized protein n=1 Tax=Mucilaginibacter xinganensis TaxID=1234841 RepID=A0A223NVY1_9SPHI|nr:hypothetical protein MuYL_1862 [Mucilaginibacter xinganensis]
MIKYMIIKVLHYFLDRKCTLIKKFNFFTVSELLFYLQQS